MADKGNRSVFATVDGARKEYEEIGATTTREDALRLLRSLDMHQAKGREGAIVVPSEWAGYAHLIAGTERYGAALWHLVDEGALVEAERYGAVFGGQPHGGLYWQMTGRGLELLRH